jgi:hypothetical protein
MDQLDRQVCGQSSLLDANDGPILGTRPCPNDVPLACGGSFLSHAAENYVQYFPGATLLRVDIT